MSTILVLRANELDRVMCMVRDCFWDDLPSGIEPTAHSRNITEEECFRGRSKASMRGEQSAAAAAFQALEGNGAPQASQ